MKNLNYTLSVFKIFDNRDLMILFFFFSFLKARAKHDITNTVVAGCVTGGAISAKGKSS